MDLPLHALVPILSATRCCVCLSHSFITLCTRNVRKKVIHILSPLSLPLQRASPPPTTHFCRYRSGLWLKYHIFVISRGKRRRKARIIKAGKTGKSFTLLTNVDTKIHLYIYLLPMALFTCFLPLPSPLSALGLTHISLCVPFVIIFSIKI